MAQKSNASITLKQGTTNIQLNFNDLRKGVVALRAVNHRLRQQIIELLAEEDNLTVTDIYVKLRVEQSVASQHLAILRRANIVLTDRQGKFIYYSLNKPKLSLIAGLVSNLAQG